MNLKMGNRRMILHPLTGRYIYDGDYVRIYNYDDNGDRKGLSIPYKLVYFQGAFDGYFLKNAHYVDYLDFVGDSEVMYVSNEFQEDVGYTYLEEDRYVDLVKIYNGTNRLK